MLSFLGDELHRNKVERNLCSEASAEVESAFSELRRTMNITVVTTHSKGTGSAMGLRDRWHSFGSISFSGKVIL